MKPTDGIVYVSGAVAVGVGEVERLRPGARRDVLDVVGLADCEERHGEVELQPYLSPLSSAQHLCERRRSVQWVSPSHESHGQR